MINVKIAASILNCDNRINGVLELNNTNIGYIHVDVMHGSFVSNVEFDNMDEIREINKVSKYPMDVHLMVEDVKAYIDSFIPYKPNIITFHLEACKDKKEVLNLIKYISLKCMQLIIFLIKHLQE